MVVQVVAALLVLLAVAQELLDKVIMAALAQLVGVLVVVAQAVVVVQAKLAPMAPQQTAAMVGMVFNPQSLEQLHIMRVAAAALRKIQLALLERADLVAVQMAL